VSRGVARAEVTAHGAKYFLLTDADIVHAPSALRRLVAKAEAENLALASLMAKLDARGFWGSLLIPAFVYFFQKLYPFPQSNDPKSPVATAAGGCMLVRRDALEAAGGIAAIRDRLIDDCALARLIKAPGSPAPRPTWIGLASNEVVSLRDNRKLSTIWDMVARAAFTQLDHSWLKLIGTVAGMLLLYIAPLLGLVAYAWHQSIAAFVLSALAFALMAVTYRPTCRLYDLPIWKTLFLPLAAFLYVLMTIASAVRHARGRGGGWKGRTYPAAS
jgi:hopene-associated glycosyltransferase HpnB